MAFRINAGSASLNSLRIFRQNLGSWNRSMERLSSGFKINRAADNPAGLVISQVMLAQIAGYDQAIENTGLATTMMQTAESGLNEVHQQLQTIRGLALDAANSGVHTTEELAVLQEQINSSLAAIDRVATNTLFNGRELLDGSGGVTGTVSAGDLEFLGGETVTAAGTYEVVVETQASQAAHTTGNSDPITSITADETLTVTNDTSGISVNVNLQAGDDAQTIVDRINESSSLTGVVATTDGTDITLTGSEYGSGGNFTVASDAVAADGSQSGFSGGAGNSATGDDIEGHFTLDGVTLQADGAGSVLTGRSGSRGEGLAVRTTAGVGTAGSVEVDNSSFTFQIGANGGQTASIAIDSIAAGALGQGLDGSGGGNQFANLGEIDITSQSGAADALAVIDRAIAEVSGARSEVGAFSANALEHGLGSLEIARENLVAAESVIRDTDIAREMIELMKLDLLLNSTTGMLAHGNTASGLILQLLID